MPSELVSPAGDSAAFAAYHSPLPTPRGALGLADVYAAERGAGGWATIRQLGLPGSSQALSATPWGVSPDHLYGLSTVTGALPEAPVDIGESYLINPDGSYELVGLGSLGSEPFAQPRYIGAGGKHIVFSTGKQNELQSIECVNAGVACKVRKLEPDAPPEGTGAVYDREADGNTRVVSLLPGDEPQTVGDQAFYKGISKDASSIAFEINGTLYVRVHNGEAGEEETQKVAEGAPTFAGLSGEGRYFFYLVGGKNGAIHRFDTSDESDITINPPTEAEIVNISADGSNVYFISEEEIGGEGTVGEPNLYVWNGSSSSYITTVAPSDLERTSGAVNGTPALANWTGWVVNKPPTDGERGPGAEASRTTSDGNVLVFESRAQLTAYDNAGHTEIYRYDETEESLVCVSCDPTGEAATADAMLQNLARVYNPMIVYNLSDDGTRVFFETADALVERDTDGVNDIYEWQQGISGSGSLELISSGQTVEYPTPPGPAGLPRPNTLFSVTPDGRDVVFLSQDVLTPGAPEGGAPALYDARVGGGFPAPQTPDRCVEEECHPSATATPSVEGPRSEKVGQNGNLKPRKHKRSCRHAARKKGRGHCTKKKANRAAVIVSSPPTSDQRSMQLTKGSSPDDPEESHRGVEHRASPLLFAETLDDFGIEEVSASESTSVAGGHPEFLTDITLNHTVNANEEPIEPARLEEATISLPPGLLGNPNSVPKCKTGELLSFDCPVDSQVGVTKVFATEIAGKFITPVYNLRPPHPDQEVARFGFIAGPLPVFIDVKVRTGSDYGATATVYGASGFVSLVSAKTTLWGNPASSAHDKERVTILEVAGGCTDGVICKLPAGERESGIPPVDRKAFMTNPSACQEGSVNLAVTSYQLLGKVFQASAPMDPITACQGLPFAPTFSAEPTSHVAGAPTGLNTKLILPQHLGEEEKATAAMREARVTLPAGMQVAAGAANWIGTCSASQVGYHEEVDAQCPDNSQLGTATITSPALPNPIEGAVYQRSPTPGHQLGLWLVVDALGLHVKFPGELEPDKATGRLAAVFHDLPQVPVSEVDLNVWGGPRAPLQNPDRCGTFTTDFTFAPHSNDPAVSGHSQMTINEGCNQPFDPKISVGVTNPVAGKFSPLIVDLTREDGNQALRGFEIALPDGEVAKLKGVPLCPDAAASAATCPAASAIGHVLAASGPGPEPLWVPQPGKPEPKVYLAGPYAGSPFSVVTEVPAQAGPFDLGTLAVRSGLGLDPETGRGVVKADPLPQFFEGVGLSYRRVHAVIDRPEFALNPTDCSQLQSTSNVTSTLGAVTHPTSPFQIEGCRALKFKPSLTLKLKGGTKRGSYPAFTAVLKARKGDANIARTSVALPHSEFLAQEHIVTVCTRKQFAADKCPKGSVYGKAKAWIPLLAKPLSGPVYLRSSSHPLPDLVMAFGGELDVNIVGRIDSKNGGIRANFDSVPDAPVAKFVMQMNGGAKGLLVNSTDICQGRHRATVRMTAQNGRRLDFRPVLRNGGCGGGKR